MRSAGEFYQQWLHGGGGAGDKICMPTIEVLHCLRQVFTLVIQSLFVLRGRLYATSFLSFHYSSRSTLQTLKKHNQLFFRRQRHTRAGRRPYCVYTKIVTAERQFSSHMLPQNVDAAARKERCCLRIGNESMTLRSEISNGRSCTSSPVASSKR